MTPDHCEYPRRVRLIERRQRLVRRDPATYRRDIPKRAFVAFLMIVRVAHGTVM